MEVIKEGIIFRKGVSSPRIICPRKNGRISMAYPLESIHSIGNCSQSEPGIDSRRILPILYILAGLQEPSHESQVLDLP